MEENNSNDSTGPLMARFYTATLVSVSLVRFKICFADVYLLNAPALTWGIEFFIFQIYLSTDCKVLNYNFNCSVLFKYVMCLKYTKLQPHHKYLIA